LFFFLEINRLNFRIRDQIPTRPQRPIIFIAEVAELWDLAHIRQWQRFEGKMMRAIYNLNICLVICLLSIIQQEQVSSGFNCFWIIYVIPFWIAFFLNRDLLTQQICPWLQGPLGRPPPPNIEKIGPRSAYWTSRLGDVHVPKLPNSGPL
jgi:hypothetical protein